MPYETLREAAGSRPGRASSSQAPSVQSEGEDPLDAPWVKALTVPRGPSGTAAEWIPDSSVQGCMVCGARFTLIKRRHHCRRCGACVCGSCSSARLPLNLLPAGRARRPQASELKRAVEKRMEWVAHDTSLEYVRCCAKCADIVDSKLKHKLRARFPPSNSEETKDLDAISV
mmetsp:Transcript_20018/g.62935  ORF Transcript_20018/g.62935 Transcript_20018/m.62935 type:complete len:172 (+) Transcript_20018:29-544(+)